MVSSGFLLLGAAASASAWSAMAPRGAALANYNMKMRSAEPFAAPAADAITENWVKMKRAGLEQDHAGADTAHLSSVRSSLWRWVTDIKIGSQTFPVQIATATSDTWVVQDGWKCLNSSLLPADYSTCNMTQAFAGTFAEGAIPDEHFRIKYGSGRIVLGHVGYDTVTVAGISVPHQEFALVDNAYFFGRNIMSGLLGLAFPGLSAVYNGTAENDGGESQDPALGRQRVYDNVFTSMWKRGLVRPFFSIALDRAQNTADSYLAFGGLPPVAVEGRVVKTALRQLDIWGNRPWLNEQWSYYTVVPDAYIVESAPGKATKVDVRSGERVERKIETGVIVANTQPHIVDTSTPIAELPNEVINAAVSKFDPPAQYDPDEEWWYVDCNATAPSFGVVFGNDTLWWDQKDLILTDSYWKPYTPAGTCPLGISNDTAAFTLGDTFLSSHVAVFDVGALEMRFLPRVPY